MTHDARQEWKSSPPLDANVKAQLEQRVLAWANAVGARRTNKFQPPNSNVWCEVTAESALVTQVIWNMD